MTSPSAPPAPGDERAARRARWLLVLVLALIALGTSVLTSGL
ncbi:hypothetical protein [Kribbella flavida]|nr:hypothetical protein [Kribbella flavida]